MPNNIFDIIKLINPKAIQILLNDHTMQQKHMLLMKKANIYKYCVPTRHYLFYICLFHGFRELPTFYRRYNSTGNNNMINWTWISRLLKMDDSFNNYRHFYIYEVLLYKTGYYFYNTRPMCQDNWQ